MNINLPKQVNLALKMLFDANFEGYVVGGCVRDYLLGNTPDDFDITTSADPIEIKEVFKNYKTVDSGIKHGTVTVIIDETPLEITTYRIDGEYFDGRHPCDVIFSRNLRDDLSRRDFTVNTICYNPFVGIVDEFGGIADLENKLIRTVGDADLRFSEDALRIIRGIRFSSVLGFQIEDETRKSILKNKTLLLNIAIERIAAEFTKLLTGDNVLSVLMSYHEVIEVFIPELKPLIGCEQKTKYHKYDVFEHTIRAVENTPNNKVLRLTMFFHDFGKPLAKTSDKNGASHFKGHADISESLARTVLKRMRFDNKTINEVAYLVKIHGKKAPTDKISAKKLLCEINYTNYKSLIKVKSADVWAKAEPHSIDDKLKLMQRLLDEIEENGECYSLKQLDINGNDLKSAGIVSGEEIREKLLFLLNAVIEEKCENKKSELLKLL